MDAAIIGRIAHETSIPEKTVAAVIALFEKGATGPFIVQYRKEVAGSLDENKVRLIQERAACYREVLDQRAGLIKTLSEQGKLNDELRTRIESCCTKVELDDLQHQFRPRKKNRAAEAIDKGLEPLAEYFWNQEPDAWGVEEHIVVFVDPAKGISTREQALEGVVEILVEWISGNFEYRKRLREMLLNEGSVVSTVVPAKVGQKTKYTMYYERREPVTSIPSHRVLAIRRGCKEGILISSIEGDASKAIEFLLGAVLKAGGESGSIFAPVLEAAVRESYNRVLRPLIETEVRAQLKERADREAIRVFQENLANLLLSPPAGPLVVMGVDWGKGDECSVAVVNEAGHFLEGTKIRFGAKAAQKGERPKQTDAAQTEALPHPVADAAVETAAEDHTAPSESAESIQAESGAESRPEGSVEGTTQNGPEEVVAAVVDESPAVIAASVVEGEFPPDNDRAESKPEAREIIRELIKKHAVRAISIGTGAGARELETALHQIISDEGMTDILIAAVNDAGIAVYSSSRIARDEFPEWSASARCAVSLARRLQDPLSELVKIDPKLIGVGQYQHDVDQKELHRGLLQTVQYCVNKVGINVNTAGESLLRYVSGLSEKLARRIVAARTAQGPFRSRQALVSAVNMDEGVFQQCAGFLRIPDAEYALDRTAVHPESYPIVEKMAAAAGIGVNELVGNRDLIAPLRLEDFVDESTGLPTLQDIREELLRPGRDPRKTFKVPKFRSDVREMSDLQMGMTLEGTVTNVTNFGAFVDVGVRQDGLVHLSQMSNRFIRDPREAVKVGDVVQVKVISVEPETKRIGLSMKALLPSIQRKRRKPQRRAATPPAARQEKPVPTSAGVEQQAAPSQRQQAAPPQRPKPHKPGEGQSRHRRRGASRPERPTPARHSGEPAAPREPEPSLQEKIAILQSKFRGIN